MKKALLAFLLAALPLTAISQTPEQKGPKDLRGILVELLKTTHNKADWFVPGNTAIAGLTADQAKWSPGKDGHSVGQLTYHLVFWNAQTLAKFKGQKPPTFDGNN